MRVQKKYCLIGVIFLQLHAFAQTSAPVADTLASNLIINTRTDSKEKILLQTDRKMYVAGEKIWFKALLLRARTNWLDTISKNLYVELLSDSDKVISQLVLNTVNLRTYGSITLPDGLATGYYWLRCYTHNMLADDTASICVQPVYIKNLFKQAVTAPLKNNVTPGGIVVNFYPEGGAMMEDVNSTAAIQVSNTDGTPVVTQGNIVNGHDSVIATFTTNKLGLAKITFSPDPAQQYFSVLYTRGKTLKTPLPAAQPGIAQLAVTVQNNKQLQARVTLNDSVYDPGFTTYLLCINRDKVCYASMGTGMYLADIPLAGFPGGINTLLLFDAGRHLLSERKIFVQKDNYTINVVADKANYAARENAGVSVEVKDIDGRPVLALLSVAVQDEHVMHVSDELQADSVLPSSILELNDWLGRNSGAYSATDVDLMMLAQPPVYNNWQTMGSKIMATDHEAAQLLKNVVGRITDRKLQPLNERVVSAISLNSTAVYMQVDTTNMGGGFQLPLPLNCDSMMLEVAVTDKKGHEHSNDSIHVNSFKFPVFSTPVALKRIFAITNITALQRIKNYHFDTLFTGTGKEWLKPVIVKTALKKVVDYDETKRISPNSYILSGDKLGHGGYGEINNAILMVPGLAIRGGMFSVLGVNTMSGASSEPMVILDGVEVDVKLMAELDATKDSPVMKFLKTLNPREIDFIEVFTGPEASAFGSRGGNGAIVINTRTTLRDDADRTPNFKIITPVMYHIAPDFAMPDYSNPTIKNNKTPDPRTTIYWNGNVITGTDGKASVHFYTADAATTYSVVVTGIIVTGEYVYKRITINRK